MVYTTLATSLHSGQDLPIPGQCHLILDTLETDGNFLLHHYISAFLRYGTASSVPRVVLVGCQHIFSHYAAIGRKLASLWCSVHALLLMSIMDRVLI
jgi:hypothetical protein